jgi:hypothetical protein
MTTLRLSDLHFRVLNAIDALGNLPDELDLPGLDPLANALIELADGIDVEATQSDDWGSIRVNIGPQHGRRE